jgi:small subunit ribosomal protein S4
MARYTGPAYKKSRRYGFSTLENGKDLAKRAYAPGQHGTDRRGKASEYGIQLNEKQKVRFMYGLNEKQFKRLFQKAGKLKVFMVKTS